MLHAINDTRNQLDKKEQNLKSTFLPYFLKTVIFEAMKNNS